MRNGSIGVRDSCWRQMVEADVRSTDGYSNIWTLAASRRFQGITHAEKSELYQLWLPWLIYDSKMKE